MTRFQSPRAGPVLTMLALVLLSGVAIAPLLTGAMIETADGAIHLYRLPILDHAFSDGSLFPRYPVATVYGYGSPLFNFYSPLSLYPMHLLHLAGMSYLNAWLAGMALYVVIAAGGAYLLGRTWGGGPVGVAAAAAYVYSPYFIYDVLWRGTTSETAALALLPYVLWAIKTQADHPSRRTFVAVILSLALFIPMHNVTTLLGGALIALYALFVVLTSRDWLRAGLRVFGALSVGALLTAFYWFPAIRETPNIKIDAITAALPDIDVTRNLVSAWSALQPPYPADPSLQQSPFAIALGWPQLALGLFGLVTLATRPRRVKFLLVLSGVAVVFLVFMLTPSSAGLWRLVPLIGYSQYPTRLLGLASLLLALLVGFGVGRLVSSALRLNGMMVRLGVPVLILIGFALPMTVRTTLPGHDPQTVVDSLDFERESGFVGSSSFGEYVPVWVETLPGETDLRDAYAASTTIPRLRPPPGVATSDADWQLTSGAFTVAAERDSVLVLDWLYLPYFQATIDGEPAEVTPSAGEGRVQLAVPTGTHRIEIWLAPSRTQAIAALVSFTALLSAAGIFLLWPILRGKPAVAYVERFPIVRETRRALIAAALAGLLALGLKAVFDTVPNPLRNERFAQGFARGAQVVTDANFGGQVTLIGYDAPAEPVPSGQLAPFSLYWTPRAGRVERDYVTVFTLRTDDGAEVAQTRDDRPGGIETHHWRSGQYVWQRAQVSVPAGTPPGEYRVSVQLYDVGVAAALDILNHDGSPLGVDLPLGTIEVRRGTPLEHAAMADLGSEEAEQYGLEIHDFEGVRALDFTGIPETTQPGQFIVIEGLWGLKERPPVVSFALQWAETDLTPVASSPLELNDPLPLAQWEAGDVWRLHHRVIVPPQADGPMRLQLIAGERVLEIGQTTVAAPDRIFERPEGIVPLGITWNNGIVLAGYLAGDGSITLVWTTEGEIREDLRRFAHRLNADGSIAQVVDGIPADWTRPISGWLPGEYVLDRVPLTDLAGQTLRFGLYDARTGQRIESGNVDSVDIVMR